MSVYFLTLVFFCFGAIFGSFLNVVILRLPRDEKLGGRSHCPHCGSTLTARDLWPIVSFIFLRGRCRHCAGRISPRYALVEIINGLLFVWVGLVLFHPQIASIVLCVRALLVTEILVVVFAIDYEHYLILDSVLLFGLVSVLCLNLLGDWALRIFPLSWSSLSAGGLIGALTSPLPFLLAWLWPPRGQWMGFGDVKLSVFLGLALGWPGWLVGFLLSVFLGGASGLVMLFFKKKTLKSQIPFGTFLAIGSFAAMFYAPQIINWYLGLVGWRVMR
ncbi:MAG: prepilin peptidase [Patescibacteria group bacterium]|nr:prepilin peptidase [Patescibacteria group bacterium]